jgi:hypothetical protein
LEFLKQCHCVMTMVPEKLSRAIDRAFEGMADAALFVQKEWAVHQRTASIDTVIQISLVPYICASNLEVPLVTCTDAPLARILRNTGFKGVANISATTRSIDTVYSSFKSSQ